MQGLERLLRPRSIAVVGGGAWCESVVEQCRKIGFAGPVWPVHPRRSEVGGVPAVASLANLPEAPDAAFVGVNRESTIDVVGELSRMGAGGAVCFASGYRESVAETGDGDALEDRLLEAAGEMRILGPNCYGALNLLDGAGLWPDQHGAVRVERGVAIVTQSSNIAINLTMQARGLPIAQIVTAGNQAQTGLSEIGRALLADERITALGLHVEGFDDLRAYEALAAEAHRLGKSVAILKVGRSEQAASATVSHSASLAGSEAGAAALIERLGFARVSSLGGLLETLKILHLCGPLTSARVGSMSCSGGEASLMADLGAEAGVEYPPLTERQARDLRAALGPRVALANPLDYHTYIWGDVAAMTETYSAMMDPGLGIGCVVLDFPRRDRCDDSGWDGAVEALTRTAERSDVPLAIVASIPETLPEARCEALMEAGILPLCGMAEALEAISAAASIHPPAEAPLALPGKAAGRHNWSEAESKAALARVGLPVPRSLRADTAETASEMAATLGFPVVLKGEGLAHKTEAGAVVLGLESAEAVHEAAAGMGAGSFLVEEMVSDGLAELLVGATRDPAHGFVLTLAAGGILTEVMADSASLLVPATRDDVAAKLEGLRVTRLLEGHRGKPAADREAILDAVMALQDFVRTRASDLIEAEINPLICGADKAVAADALIITGETQ